MALTTELPIGLKIKGDTKKVFSVNDLLVEDLKQINDRQYKSDHPMVWLGKTIGKVIKEIDGTPISAIARTEKGVPEAVRKLTLVDVSYLLVSGHVYNLGPDLPNFKANCPACGSHVAFDVNLIETLELPDTESLEPDSTFTVELLNGFEFKEKNAKDLGLEGLVFTEYEFRLPTLGDAIRNERYYNATSESTFSERVMASCLVSVRTSDRVEMEEKIMQMLNANLITKLSLRDMKKIGTEYTEIAPSFSLTSETMCKKCGRGVEVPIDPNFLYQA